MKMLFKSAIVAATCLGLAGLATSRADTPSFVNVTATTAVSSGGARATVGMTARFISAATYTVQPKVAPSKPGVASPIVNVGEVHEAHLVIGGAPGESVQVSCAVKSGHGSGLGTRDCGGAPAVEEHAVVAGHQLDDGILLTKDLLPGDTGNARSAIVLDVSYL